MIRHEDVYRIGRIGKPHGVGGELSFMFDDDVFDRCDAEYLVLDIDGILQGKCANVRLQPGDIVYVPHDNMSEYNVFVRKLLPTAQFLSTFTAPALHFID